MLSSFLKLGVIGDPIVQSPSPEMFRPALKKLGLQASYDRYYVKSDDLENFIMNFRKQNFTGINVTLPHKQTIIAHLDNLTTDAKNIGAVNTVYWQNEKLIGDNTDGAGYVLSLKNHLKKSISKSHVVVLGCGGASRAICYTLLKEGCENLTLINRTQEKALSLKKDLKVFFENAQINVENWSDFFANNVFDYDILINATSLGLLNKNPWLHLDFLKKASKDSLISDIVANPIETKLLKKASYLNLKTIPGWEMLLGQGVLAFQKFTNQKPDIELMKNSLLNTLQP